MEYSVVKWVNICLLLDTFMSKHSTVEGKFGFKTVPVYYPIYEYQLILAIIHHGAMGNAWFAVSVANPFLGNAIRWSNSTDHLRVPWGWFLYPRIVTFTATLLGGRLNKKDGLTRYGDSHVKDKTS